VIRRNENNEKQSESDAGAPQRTAFEVLRVMVDGCKEVFDEVAFD